MSYNPIIAFRAAYSCLFDRRFYHPVMKLQGPQGPNTLSLSAAGRQLASGGDDGLRIWDLPNGNSKQTPDYDPLALGQVTAIKWASGSGGEIGRLLIGTGIGNLILWKYDITEDRFREVCTKENAHAGAVEGISVNEQKVAAIYRLHMVMAFIIEDSGLRQTWMYRFGETIPRSVAHFEGDILVWGLMDGAMHRLKGDTGKPIDMKVFPERIGCVAYRQAKGRIEYAIDILDNGCKIYRSPETKEMYRFCKVPRHRAFVVCTQALWIEDEQLLAYGSDHGKVYLFDEKSSCVQKLRHGGKDEIVQTIAFSKAPTQWILATTTMEGNGTIRIWTKERGQVSKWGFIRLVVMILTVMIIMYNCAGILTATGKLISRQMSGHTNRVKQVVGNIPALLKYTRHAPRKVLRFVVNLSYSVGQHTWEWVQREERIDHARWYRRERAFIL